MSIGVWVGGFQGIVIPHQHPYGIGKYGNGQGTYFAVMAARFTSAK